MPTARVLAVPTARVLAPDRSIARDCSGAAALFGRTFDEHAHALAAWLQLAMLPPEAAARLRPLPRHVLTPDRRAAQNVSDDPLQTEYFLQARLLAAGVAVHPIPFHRSDVRRMAYKRNGSNVRQSGLSLCVPSLYWYCYGGGPSPLWMRRHEWHACPAAD